MKTISCKDMGVDCPWVGKGETVDELVEKSKQHAMEHHPEYWESTMRDMSDEEIKKAMEGKVREE